MGDKQKKIEKKIYKQEKKLVKKNAKRQKKIKFKNKTKPQSKFILFADLVKGIIYLILSLSLIVSIILGEKGLIITLDDIINNLFFAKAGKIILFVIAAGLFFYGLKQLKILK